MGKRQTVDIADVSRRLERVLQDAAAAGISSNGFKRMIQLLKDHPVYERLGQIADEATAAAGGDEARGLFLFMLKVLNEKELLAEAIESYFRILVFTAGAGQHSGPGYEPKHRLHTLISQLPESQIADVESILEDILWMETDLSHLGEFEPYEWGPDGPPPGRPLRYIPGVGIVVDDEEDNRNA